eukprot:3534923-Prymnesium_polylepis.1
MEAARSIDEGRPPRTQLTFVAGSALLLLNLQARAAVGQWIESVRQQARARTPHLSARPHLDLRHRQALLAAVAAKDDVQHDLLRLRTQEHQ